MPCSSAPAAPSASPRPLASTSCSSARYPSGAVAECCFGGVASIERTGELGLVGLLDLLVGHLGLGHLGVDLGRAGGEIGLLRRTRLGHRAGGTHVGRRGARLVVDHRLDRLGRGLGLVRRRVRRLLDVLLGLLLAALDETLDLFLGLPGLARALEVVDLLEVLGRRRVDRLLDRSDERLLVEDPGLLLAHLVDLGGGCLAGDVVARRDSGALSRRGAFCGRLMGLDARACALGGPLHRLEVRVVVRVANVAARTGRGRTG